ncbi:hypothetical protein [Bacillus pseudomycoides]|uniref:hypothetical protein n=1 Tax=Bacillus pseudomycoides TaxID=64104 RepID=UPI001155BAE3|nr:hypothetical protein [Bacillus pseudomycoides]
MFISLMCNFYITKKKAPEWMLYHYLLIYNSNTVNEVLFFSQEANVVCTTASTPYQVPERRAKSPPILTISFNQYH